MKRGDLPMGNKYGVSFNECVKVLKLVQLGQVTTDNVTLSVLCNIAFHSSLIVVSFDFSILLIKILKVNCDRYYPQEASQ